MGVKLWWWKIVVIWWILINGDISSDLVQNTSIVISQSLLFWWRIIPANKLRIVGIDILLTGPQFVNERPD